MCLNVNCSMTLTASREWKDLLYCGQLYRCSTNCQAPFCRNAKNDEYNVVDVRINVYRKTADDKIVILNCSQNILHCKQY